MKTETRERICAFAISLAMTTAGACGVSGGSPPGSSGIAGASPTGAAGGATTGAAGAAVSGAAGSSTTGTAGSTGAAGIAGAAGVGGSTAGGGAAGTAAGGTGGNGTTGAAGSLGAAGTAPLSGITINIGGTEVPKENAIAFIHFGHSNMAGRGVDSTATRGFFFGPTDPHAWMYHSGTGFEPAVEPKTAGDGGNTVNGMTSGGPGTALVKEAVALAPDKYFISLGFGQSSAYCSQFVPGSLYYNKLIAGAKELKGKVTFAAIMIYLGITERHGTQADVNNFPQCINQLVTAIRTDLGELNLPMFLNDYEMGTTGPLAPVASNTFYTAIHPKILMVPSVVSNSFIIPTDGVSIQDDHSTNDDHHFSLDGHKEYVRRLLMTMQQKGLFPWQ